jgi:hypothetical protein
VALDDGAGGAAGGGERAAREAAGEGRAPLLITARTSADSLPELLPGLCRRVHFVRARGPLHDAEGAPLAYYYTARPNAAVLDAEDVESFEEGRDLLQRHRGLHLSFTSPFNLLEEFFTVKGSGTMLRRGSVIRAVPPGEVDRQRLEALLAESFRRPLRSMDWFEAVDHAYIEEDYRGAALLEEHPQGAYLSKFAVGTEARGEGLAQELWDELAGRHPALFWRSRRENPVNQWYEKKATGHFTTEAWNVYWRGVRAGDVAWIVERCDGRAPDFD